MKNILSLVVASLIVASSFSATADKPRQAGNESAETSQSIPPGLKKKGGVPPGLQKKGGLPPGQARKQNRPPSDLLITNAPMTNVVVHPARPTPPPDESKRVESPRGKATSESTPPATTDKTPAAARAATPAPTTPGDTAKFKRELDADLQLVNAGWVNLKTRNVTLNGIAAETGVNSVTILTQSKANKSLGGGDLLMANKIGAVSGKSFDDVMATYRQNKEWLATGESFGVPATALTDAAKRVGTAR